MAKGNIVEDQVCLGQEWQLCAKTRLISAFEMDETPFGFLPFDGILGLGLPESSVTPDFNLAGNLAGAQVFRNDRFAVWLADASDGEDSEVSFGEMRPERFASELVWMSVERGGGLWVVPLEDLVLDGRRLGLCAAGCRAALDTGTSVLGVPPAQMQALTNELQVSD